MEPKSFWNLKSIVLTIILVIVGLMFASMLIDLLSSRLTIMTTSGAFVSGVLFLIIAVIWYQMVWKPWAKS
jgi:uncharacterized membrane protein YdcZ (DUF606 family)